MHASPASCRTCSCKCHLTRTGFDRASCSAALQAQAVAEMAVAPAAALPLAERADFAVEVCSIFGQAADLSRARAPGRQALLQACAVQSCTLLLSGMGEVLQALPTLPASEHQAEASLTQQALMLLGKVCAA